MGVEVGALMLDCVKVGAPTLYIIHHTLVNSKEISSVLIDHYVPMH